MEWMARNRWMRRTMLVTASWMSTATPAVAQLTQPGLDRLAGEMGYRVEIVDNGPAACPAGIDGCFLSTVTLTMPATLPAGLKPEALQLYFSFVNRLPLVESDVFRNEWINGDLNRLSVRPGATLRPGARYTVRLWGQGAHYSVAHVMPNAYLVADGLRARTVAASRPTVDPDTGLEVLPFVAPMTNEARLATKTPADKTRWLTAERAFALHAERAANAAAADAVVVLPRPARAERPDGPALDLTRGVSVRLTGVERAALAPALVALEGAGARVGGGAPLRVRVDPASPLAAEGYRLDADARGVAITAKDAAGARHALRSLAQQVAFEGGRLRPLRIEDAPRYGFRGLHIDLGRNFHGRPEILKIVEAMAMYKFNRLHLHLAEDEGWRLEIADLPELTAIGGRRCHDPSERRCLMPQLGAGPDGAGPVNGFLSRADYVAIVRVATDRGIEVIPSIDMPGHSRAAIRAMEARFARLTAAGRPEEAARYRLIDPADTTTYLSIQNYKDNTLNVCLPSTYRFIDAVVADIAAMHRTAGAPLRTFHLGADETAGAWKNSPACAAMLAAAGGDSTKLTPRFIERVSKRLAEQGYRPAGWSDGMGHTDAAAMPRDVQTNIWGTMHTGAIREAHDQANRGWATVLSIPDLGYFDMPYAPHPAEWGYDWASRGVDTHQVFAFMPGNLPANAALIGNTAATYQSVADEPRLAKGGGVAGIQGQLWSETVRTDAMAEYMLFPRLLALAERAWSPAPWEPAYQPGATWTWQDPRIDHAALDAGWRDFAGRLAAQLPLLDRAAVAYRLAPPGARIAGGRLEANTELPGTPVEYRTAGGAWTRYTGPVAVRGRVELRTRTPGAARASRIVTVGAAR